MAKYHPHPLGQVSGKIGGLIVRRQRNGTNVLARVGEPSTRTPSDGQLAQQLRLTGAMAYAKGVLADPWHRRAYEVIARERNRRVDKLVVRDYLLPPVVEDLDVSAYTGQPGAALRAYAVDDIQVVAVVFAIRTAAGALVEEGAAREVHGIWWYTTTAAAPRGDLTITATAQDRPGNHASRTAAVRTEDPGGVLFLG